MAIVDKINTYLSSEEKTLDEAIRYEFEKIAGVGLRRQFMERNERGSGKLYLSGCGKCPRQQAYGYHGFTKNGKEMDSRSSIVFLMGDLTEACVVALAQLAGVKLLATGLKQVTVSLDIDGQTINGHPDGIIHTEEGLKLFECKSMSSYAFKKFQAKDIDYSYLCQMNAYMEALGLTECIIVALAKDSGVLGEQTIVKDDKIVKDAKKRMSQALSDTLPEPEYECDEKKFYPWQCLYCAWHYVCHPHADKVLVRNSYKLKEGEREVLEEEYDPNEVAERSSI
jgi:hypothetical protein